MGRVLILAGTAEARAVCAAVAGCDVLASLAGVTAAPRDLGVPTRVGGFGGDAGFAAALAGVSAVLDATHPFAATMTARAARICAAQNVPYLRLTRPGFGVVPGAVRHASVAAAARAMPRGGVVFLASGPGALQPFLGRGLTVHCRRIDHAAPEEGVNWIIGRPPFTVSEETALFTLLGITHLVTKDSGGDRAKLTAAGALGLAVHIIDRPAPAGGEDTHDIQQAIAFVRAHAGKLAHHRD